MTLQTTINEARLAEFLDTTIRDLAASYGGVMVVLGRKLGLYQALAGQGPLSSVEVAQRAGCAERYVREWLNSQVAGGYLDYHPDTEMYEMSPEQALVLADESSSVYMPLAWEVPASMWLDEAKTLEAFRTGLGVPWSEHHPRLFSGVAAFYRNGYESAIIRDWLPSLSGVVAKLELGATVADVGCGFGHSTVIMARSFPNSTFFGYDTHVDSIDSARKLASDAGLDNVRFEVGGLTDTERPRFDLVCFFDALHDMGDPLTAARRAKEALTPGGTVMLVEPFANDRVEQNINPVGRLYYSASTTLCVAHSLSEETGLALGAQAGETRLSKLFEAAGYTTFRRASETPFNLILEARV